MRESQIRSEPWSGSRGLAWRDTAVVIGITVFSVILSAHFDLNEGL
jgi:hypothetical protein